MYEVVVSKSAEKKLASLPKNIIEKIVPVLILLEENPRPIGCKKLKGYTNLWRLRIGNYRVIYSIEDVIKLVDIREIGHRKDIYK